MSISYLKRYRMEIDLTEAVLPRVKLPEGFHWHAWSAEILPVHGLVKYLAFRHEMDAQLFHTFRSLIGCEDLMRSIATHPRFLAKATWLISHAGKESEGEFTHHQGCGTIQGLFESTTAGAIQNVAVSPEYRGFGLGRALVMKALRGFRSHGLLRVHLDVTAENVPAVNLYESVGFRVISTSYKPISPESL